MGVSLQSRDLHFAWNLFEQLMRKRKEFDTRGFRKIPGDFKEAVKSIECGGGIQGKRFKYFVKIDCVRG